MAANELDVHRLRKRGGYEWYPPPVRQLGHRELALTPLESLARQEI